MKYIIFTFLLCLTNQILFGQKNNSNKTEITIDDDGKCYAQCRKPSIYIDTVKEYFIFTGDRSKENVNLEEIVTKFIPASEEWVKKKSDSNCLSPNPDDCLVWCLQKMPEVKETILLVIDTSQTKNYKSINLPHKKEIINQKLYKQEVLCNSKLDKSLVKKIQKKLKKLDYFDYKINGDIDPNLEAALIEFQNTNALFIGGFTIESIKAMDIKL